MRKNTTSSEVGPEWVTLGPVRKTERIYHSFSINGSLLETLWAPTRPTSLWLFIVSNTRPASSRSQVAAFFWKTMSRWRWSSREKSHLDVVFIFISSSSRQWWWILSFSHSHYPIHLLIRRPERVLTHRKSESFFLQLPTSRWLTSLQHLSRS